jgi:hypothetical protein
VRTLRSLLPVLLLAAVFAVFVYFYLVLPQGPFSWDEAHHSTFSLLIARSIREGDIRAFWHFTNAQTYWPFLHSWVSSLFLLVGGYSYAAARCANVAIGSAALLLIFLAGRRLTSPPRGSLGLAAALLLAASPMFLFFSSTAMIENLGLLLTLGVVYYQIRSLPRGDIPVMQAATPRRRSEQTPRSAPHKSFRPAGVSGLILGLLYLTKYEYAQFAGLGLILFWLSRLAIPEGEGARRRCLLDAAAACGGFLLVWSAWMIIPPASAKWGVVVYRFFDTGKFNPMNYTRAENRLFHLRSLLYSYTFSPAIYLLYAGGLIHGFIRFRDLRLRLLLAVFLATLIPMSLILNSQERFIYTSTPALYLLSAAAAMELAKKSRRPAIWAGAAAAVVLIGDLPKLPVYIHQVGNAVIGAYSFRDGNRLDCSTFFGLVPYPKFLRPAREYFNPKAAGRIPAHTPEDLVEFLWSVSGSRGSVCAPFYIGSLSPHLWQWHAIARHQPIFTDWRPDAYFFPALAVSDDSPHRLLWNTYLIDGRVKEWNAYLAGLEQRGLMKPYVSRSYPDAGLSLTIYVKNRPLSDPAWRSLRFP